MTTEKKGRRRQLLDDINSLCDELGIKRVARLGDASKGEIEITGMPVVHDHAKRFFYQLTFPVLLADGREGEFTQNFNANSAVSDGSVIVVLINGKFAIVKEWRLPLGRWMHGVPRGFGDKLDEAKIKGELGNIKIGDLPLGTLVRELGEEVMANAEVRSVTHLGNLAQNSGTDTTTPSYFLVQLDIPEDQLNQKLRGTETKQDLKVELWNAEKVDREMGGLLADQHTFCAITLATRYIRTLPRFE